MNTLLARLAGIGKTLWDFLAPIIRNAASNMLAELLPIALDVVASLASTDRSGAQKREAAVAEVTRVAVATGVRAAESTVRLAIELAVARLKSEGAR